MVEMLELTFPSKSDTFSFATALEGDFAFNPAEGGPLPDALLPVIILDLGALLAAASDTRGLIVAVEWNGGEGVSDSANIPRAVRSGANCASEGTPVVWLDEGSGSANPRADGVGGRSGRHALRGVVRNRNEEKQNVSNA
jgi:hypothetical protein